MVGFRTVLEGQWMNVGHTLKMNFINRYLMSKVEPTHHLKRFMTTMTRITIMS